MLKLFYLKLQYHFLKNLYLLIQNKFIQKIIRLVYFSLDCLWIISYFIREYYFIFKSKKNSFKLFFLKLQYHFLKIIYLLIQNKFIQKIIRLVYFSLYYLWIISYFIREDYFVFKSRKNSFKEYYINLGFFKHIFFLFLFITGVIPLLFFIYFVFFSFKYFFKYSFITLDYLYPNLDENYLYTQIKKFINRFFYLIPNFLIKIYRYFFGGGWRRFFWELFKNYWKRKWIRFLNYFFKVTDEFLLVTLPRIYDKLCDKSSDFYYWVLISFFKSKRIYYESYWWIRRKIFRFVNRYRKRFRRITRRIRKKYRRLSRSYDYTKRKYYYLWYYWYIWSYIYYCWIFKKYIWSEMFKVTLEAFFFIFRGNCRACLIYSIALFFTRIEYIYCHFFYWFWPKWIWLGYTLKNSIDPILNKLRCFKVDIKTWYWNHAQLLLVNLHWLAMEAIYHEPEYWYWVEHECYEVDKGYISLMYWGHKFYSVIQRFFARLYPTPLRWFNYQRKYYYIVYRTIYEYLIIIIFRRFMESCYFKYYFEIGPKANDDYITH